MRSKKILMIIAALCLCVLCQITALAQGGWDVWTVYLRDGSRIDAAPVWSLDKNVLKYGMSGEVGEGKHLKRSLISSMSRNVLGTRLVGRCTNHSYGRCQKRHSCIDRRPPCFRHRAHTRE
jgi:hypothetical protein